MELKNLNDEQLWAATKKVVSEEKQKTVEVLDHLSEVEARMLYAKKSYPSLFEYCVRELGYSEGGAQRRILAMRLVRDVPLAKAALLEERTTIATLSMAQGFFQREKWNQKRNYSPQEKAEVIHSLLGKSTRENEITLARLSPKSAPNLKERVTTVVSADGASGQEMVEVKMYLSGEVVEMLEELKQKMNLPLGAKLGHVVERLARERTVARQREKVAKVNAPARPTAIVAVEKASASRYVPASVRREVFARDRFCCTFVDKSTGRKCEAKQSLELDHAQPWACGGKNTTENLRVRCRAHNQLWAREKFGKLAQATV